MNKRHEFWNLCLVGLLASAGSWGPAVWDLLTKPHKRASDGADPNPSQRLLGGWRLAPCRTPSNLRQSYLARAMVNSRPDTDGDCSRLRSYLPISFCQRPQDCPPTSADF